MKHPLSVRLLSCSALALALVACAPKEAPPEPVRAVRTLVVSGVASAGAHDYAAEIRARTESRLGFRVGGKLQSRLVNNGDTVRAGQVLARLDPSDLRLGQDAARAAQLAAQTNLDQLDADLQRYRDLRAQGFIGPAELDRREAAVKAARAQLDQARAQATVQGNQATYATLTAEASGTVTGIEAEPGQVLASGTPVVRLALDGPRDAVFSVPEDQVNGVRALLGKPGAVGLMLWGTATGLPATVHEVAGAADPVTRTFLVKADVGSAAVRLGQTATLRINLPVQAAVIRLPLTALFEAQGHTQVWLLDRAAGTVHLQAVMVGGAEGNEVVIAQGLKAGDEVVVAGTHALTPDMKVRPFVEPSAKPPVASSVPAASAAASR